MFKKGKLTDFEKLMFAESYIKELKSQLELHKNRANTATEKLARFVMEVKLYSKDAKKLLTYKKDQGLREAKIREYKKKIDKLESENSRLREKNKFLKTQRNTVV